MTNLALITSVSSLAAKTTRPVNNRQSVIGKPEKFLSMAMSGRKLTSRSEGPKLPFLASPFQASLLFTTARQRSTQSGLAAYVCYLNGQQVLEVERLHSLRGHNPTVNLTRVLNQARHNKAITGIIVATWQDSTSEYPYAGEFIDEVYRQYEVLDRAGVKLIDHLRISDTGVYSYFGDHEGPYSDADSGQEKSICRLY